MTLSLSALPPARANLIGSLFMVAAMGLFSLEDTFVKLVAGHLPVGETLLFFGAGGATAFALIAGLKGEALANRDVLSRSMRVRFLFEFTGRLFYVLALALTPLSAVTAILQATPIMVVLGAALFFGETVGWRRWTAILIGMIGVLVVIQPGAESFSPLSILAVIGMIGFAGRDLASRAAPKSLSTNVLGFYGFVTILIAGAVYSLWDGAPLVAPSARDLVIIGASVGCGVLAYSALMQAMRTGEVSSVAPFRYTRLLFGVGLGVFVFGETLTRSTLLGCLLIVAAGLFILFRGKPAKG